MKYPGYPVSGLFAVALAVLGSAAAAQADPFRLIVTHLEPPLVPNSVMDLAEELGYFDRAGVDVELVRVQQTPSALAAMQAGDGDMANISVDALLQLVARGEQNLRAVISPNKSLPFLIAAKDEIETPGDLVGRSFGVGRIGSLDHSLSAEVLESQGVDMDDLQIVSLGQPNVRGQALVAGQIDATTMSIGVWTSLPDKEGLHVLVSADDYYAAAPVVNKVNVVTTRALQERPEDVEAVIRALIEISRDVAEDPRIWVDAMAELRPDVARADLEQLAEAFAGSWSVNGGMNAQELATTVDWLYEGEDFQDLRRVEAAEWIDYGPLDNVLSELGTYPDLDQPAR